MIVARARSPNAYEITESRKQKSFLLNMKAERRKLRLRRQLQCSLNALHNNYGHPRALPVTGPFQLSAQSGQNLIKKPSFLSSTLPLVPSPSHLRCLAGHLLTAFFLFLLNGRRCSRARFSTYPGFSFILAPLDARERGAPNKSKGGARSYVQKRR